MSETLTGTHNLITNSRFLHATRMLISVSLVIVLFVWVGWGEFIQSVKQVSLIPAIGATLCLISLFTLGGLNVWLLLRALHPVPFMRFIVAFLHGYAIALIMPGQLGDASLTLFLKNSGVPIHKSASAYLIDKITTLILFSFVAACGLYLLSLPQQMKWILLFLLAFVFLIFGGFFVLLKTQSKVRFLQRFSNTLLGVTDGVGILAQKWYLLLVNISLTCVKWLLMTLCYGLAFRSFGIELAWSFAGTIPVISTLIGYIPISAGGIGLVELSAVYWFSLIGIEKQGVLCVYVLLRALQYIIAGVLLLLVKAFLVRSNCQHNKVEKFYINNTSG